mgnify:FL=1
MELFLTNNLKMKNHFQIDFKLKISCLTDNLLK